MNIEINDEYIQWIKDNPFDGDEMTIKEIEDYINDVLKNHQDSWDLEIDK